MAQAMQNCGESNGRLVCRVLAFTPVRGQIFVGIDRDGNDIEYVLDVQDGSIDRSGHGGDFRQAAGQLDHGCHAVRFLEKALWPRCRSSVGSLDRSTWDVSRCFAHFRQIRFV